MRISNKELRAIRHRLGLTQLAMAAILGISVRNYRAYECFEKPVPRLVAFSVKYLNGLHAEDLRKAK